MNRDHSCSTGDATTEYNGTMGLNILGNIGRLGSSVEHQRMNGSNHKSAMVI